jgi:AbrB family looped-hinge helix DNA binding protein
MRVTSRGQVTIPQDARERFGFLPHTEVELVVEGETVFLCKTNRETTACAPGSTGCAARPTSR